MTWGYSLDLRKKVIEYVNSGHSKAEACRVFKIGKNTIFEWLKKLKNGSLERKKRENKARKLDKNIIYIDECGLDSGLYREYAYAPKGEKLLQKFQENVVIPYKKYRKKPLTEGQKEHNRKLASFRMRVENKIREIKIFKIISNVYRNFQKKYNMRFNIIAGIVNLRHGF